MHRIKLELAASRRVCAALTDISSTFSHKRLNSRQLFLLLYVLRCREHLSSIVLLLENESYNSALALRRVLFETFLRGLWIRHCATADVIERARKNNFKLNFDGHVKLQEDLIESAERQGLDKESKFYKLGCGFVHGGLYETAMYALPTHPKVSEHLSRTVRRELRYSTLRVLQIFLEHHLSLLEAIRDGKEHGTRSPDAVLAATSSIRNLAEQYRSEVRGVKQADAPGKHDAGNQEKPNMDRGIEADTATLEQCVESGLTGELCESAYRGINGWLTEHQPSSKDALFKRAQVVAAKYAKSRSW